MRKIVLNMNMTCDGFFNLDWMGQITPDQEIFEDNIGSTREADNTSEESSGGAFVGYPFYRGMVTFWSNMENSPQSSESQRAVARAVNTSHRIVISRTYETVGEHAELLVAESDQDLVEAVTRLKQQEGSNFAVIGGVRTAQTFVRLGLIDEYVLLVHPVAIGQGSRVFTDRVNLELISAKTYKSGVMRVFYRPRP